MTDAQKIFCDEYLKDLNATRAYKVAYPRITKDSTANSAASRLLRIVKVQNYINEEMKKREERTQVTQDMIVKELAAVAFAKITDFVRVKKGKVIIDDTDNLEEANKKAIVSIKEGKNGIEVGMANKMQAIEMLGRHLGMFRDKMEVLKSTDEVVEEINKYIAGKISANDG